MFILYADKNKLTLRQREPVTSGSANVYPVCFEFSGEWDGLERVAVFKSGGETVRVLLDGSGQCVIPWEVLQKPMLPLEAGVCGTYGGDTVLPTVWANLGTILPGAAPVEPSLPPTPELWRQELERKQDRLRGLPGQVAGFNEAGDLVPVDMLSGGTAYQFGHGLKKDGVTVSVDMASDENPDKTLPVSAAAMEAAVGNINVLLGTI